MARFEIDIVGPENIRNLVKSLVEVGRIRDEAKIDVNSVVERLKEGIRVAVAKTPLK